jgi:hypothetical protein
MSKSTFFIGQPIFSQILNLLPKSDIQKAAKKYSADRYCKKFKTYDHLLVMLYAIFNRCTSIREVTTGIMACHSKLFHLGVQYTIRRSTLSDANKRRSADVFEDIYMSLYSRFRKTLSDSQTRKVSRKLFIIDSTTITLFQEILKAAGRPSINGRRKGGIKAHTLMKADEDVPQMIRFSPGAANDISFMKKISVPKGSILVFDRAYRDYTHLERWSNEGVTWVTRLRGKSAVERLLEKLVSIYQKNQGVISDTVVCLGNDVNDKLTKVQARLIKYFDKENNRTFEFITNNFDYSPVTIAQLYKKRWQIETLFKRIKQTYPLRDFLGDNENAIKIQIWCALIADLLLKVIHSRVTRNWSFANLASMVRLHLMTYINLYKFLNKPEKSLLQVFIKLKPLMQQQLFAT